MLRLRPDSTSFIENNLEKPYEIHLVEFSTDNDFEAFMKDEDRKKFLYLKEQYIKSV